MKLSSRVLKVLELLYDVSVPCVRVSSGFHVRPQGTAIDLLGRQAFHKGFKPHYSFLSKLRLY
jgi:hypothetical protein